MKKIVTSFILSCALVSCASGVTSIHSSLPTGIQVLVRCETYDDVDRIADAIETNRNKFGWVPVMSGWKQSFIKPKIYICYEKPKPLESKKATVAGKPASPPSVGSPTKK